MDQILVSLGLLLVGASISFFVTLYLKKRDREQAATLKSDNRAVDISDDLTARINLLEKHLATLDQTVLPISAAFQAMLVKELTHYHTPAVDVLLAKLGPPYVLTEYEEEQLILALDQRTRDMDDRISPSERDAAHMLPFVMKRAKREGQLLSKAPLAWHLITVATPRKED